jgi:hypothetical protein
MASIKNADLTLIEVEDVSIWGKTTDINEVLTQYQNTV